MTVGMSVAGWKQQHFREQRTREELVGFQFKKELFTLGLIFIVGEVEAKARDARDETTTI